ncbi:Acetyltransferase [Rubrivivax sp. A210]|uniref:GNAT family N-acetyltransferase n=1 Tax=Rubrivivax sp. A210 TaxID=2772301 RepID=UPI0019C7E95E|nr:Acetyltransferase [Rubrivivax sp. A210]
MNPPLRKPRHADAPALAQLFTDPAIRKYLGGPRDKAQAQAGALDLITAGRQLPAWVIVLPGSQNPVGFVSLDNHHDGEDIEVSFVLTPEAQGLGLGRASVAAALAEAWQLGLGHVVAETQSANARSIRLLGALGFSKQREFIRFNAAQALFSIHQHSTNERPGG